MDATIPFLSTTDKFHPCTIVTGFFGACVCVCVCVSACVCVCVCVSLCIQHEMTKALLAERNELIASLEAEFKAEKQELQVGCSRPRVFRVLVLGSSVHSGREAGAPGRRPKVSRILGRQTFWRVDSCSAPFIRTG